MIFSLGKNIIYIGKIVSEYLIRFEKSGFISDPTQAVLDFDEAAMNVVTSILCPHVVTRMIFFTLLQAHGLKLNLVNYYRENGDCKPFC